MVELVLLGGEEEENCKVLACQQAARTSAIHLFNFARIFKEII
jgi:hypothetical protein